MCKDGKFKGFIKKNKKTIVISGASIVTVGAGVLAGYLVGKKSGLNKLIEEYTGLSDGLCKYASSGSYAVAGSSSKVITLENVSELTSELVEQAGKDGKLNNVITGAVVFTKNIED